MNVIRHVNFDQMYNLDLTAGILQLFDFWGASVSCCSDLHTGNYLL